MKKGSKRRKIEPLSTYLLIECDFRNNEVRITNLGQFNKDDEAEEEANRIQRYGSDDSRAKVLRVFRGALIDIRTSEMYCESDKPLTITL